jgi:hypothetical protein
VLADGPHLRGARLVEKIYAKTTLAQSHALDDWLAELPDHLFGGQP